MATDYDAPRRDEVDLGEDSLEAHVGYLAALTGGEIFVAAGADLGAAMVAAFAILRRPHAPLESTDGAE